MAAGLGYKDFVTGDVLTAGDVNGYLMQGILVFANATARSAAITSPQEGQFSFLKDTNSTEYYTGSAWVASGGGGGGKVLQVVTATTQNLITSSSATYADTDLTATITPSATSSRILVLVTQLVQAYFSGSGAETFNQIRLLRAGTSIFETRYANRMDSFSSELIVGDEQSFSYVDSPSTTSATIYKTQFNRQASGTFTVQPGYGTSTITLLEIGA